MGWIGVAIVAVVAWYFWPQIKATFTSGGDDDTPLGV